MITERCIRAPFPFASNNQGFRLKRERISFYPLLKVILFSTKRTFFFLSFSVVQRAEFHTLIVLSAEPVQNQVLLGSTATDRTHPK